MVRERTDNLGGEIAGAGDDLTGVGLAGSGGGTIDQEEVADAGFQQSELFLENNSGLFILDGQPSVVAEFGNKLFVVEHPA